MGKTNFVAHGRTERNRPQEFHKLGRPHDGKGGRTGLDELFLRKLCAKISAVLEPVRSHDRERDMMADAGFCSGCLDISAGRPEEVHRGLVFERRRVGQVDQNVRPGERFCEALSSYRVDPGSEEHTSELQALMRISYAVFCLKKKKKTQNHYTMNIKVSHTDPVQS